MGVVSSRAYAQDGRTRGMYLYMLLCQSAGIHIKIGVSDNPLERLIALSVGCPLPLGVLATTMFPSRKIAFRAEKMLHHAFADHHENGEWFRFSPDEKAVFNSTLRIALSVFASPSTPIRWTKLNVQVYLKHQRSASMGKHRAVQRRGKSFRDFRDDGGEKV